MKKETTKELQAVYYGKVELIPGIECDGYVLSDNTVCLSERGTAELLGMKHAPLFNAWHLNGLQKYLNRLLVRLGAWHLNQ